MKSKKIFLFTVICIFFVISNCNKNSEFDKQLAENNNDISQSKQQIINEMSIAELKNALRKKENETAISLISGKCVYLENLFSDKKIEITLKNAANVAIFKDIAFKLTYFSKTQSVIGEKEIVVYEYLNPQATISKTYKLNDMPEEAILNSTTIKIVKAMPADKNYDNDLK